MGIFAAIIFILLVIMIFVLLALHLLTAIALYLFAKDAGIENPWLSFIPYGNYFLLGNMAGEISLGNIRIKNPGIVLLIVSFVSGFLSAFSSVFSNLNEENVTFALIFLVISVISMIISLAVGAFLGFIYYNIFRKYGENNAILFAVLSCVVPFALPIILFYMRKKYLKPNNI
ncbi:MAG: hypothetical protein IKZ25_00640 [Clostridia bacterium]|nr:hypothetical protein [Clostridia bacterium]